MVAKGKTVLKSRSPFNPGGKTWHNHLKNHSQQEPWEKHFCQWSRSPELYSFWWCSVMDMFRCWWLFPISFLLLLYYYLYHTYPRMLKYCMQAHAQSSILHLPNMFVLQTSALILYSKLAKIMWNVWTIFINLKFPCTKWGLNIVLDSKKAYYFPACVIHNILWPSQRHSTVDSSRKVLLSSKLLNIPSSKSFV